MNSRKYSRRKLFRRVRHIEEMKYAMLPGEQKLESGVFYIVANSPFVEYECPCGCGGVVILPTRKNNDGTDGWELTEKEGKVTLDPAVVTSGLPCASKYFIRDNIIVWL